MKKLLLTMLLVPTLANAEMIGMKDKELQTVNGQSGITVNARLDFGEGTRVSFSTDHDNIDYDPNSVPSNTRTWLVFNELTGGIEFEGLKIDLTDTFGPNQSEEAIVVTLPERIEFNQLDIEGLYLADSEIVTGGDDRYIMGLSLDGSLYLPASTKVNVFPTN